MDRSRELAQLLLRKAAQDEFTMDKLLPDPASPDEVIGFHAQQAVEKMVKAVLSAKRIRYRYTHDLRELVLLLRKNHVAFPEDLKDVSQLNPFAVGLRYDEQPAESEEPFDRSWAVECVRRTRAWAESILRGEQ